MKVILLRRVEKLGFMGDIVTVAPGFFRNFLFPRGFADRATEDRITKFEADKAQIEAENLREKQEAENVAAKMDGITLTFIRSAGDTGMLYGSIRTQEIAQEIVKQGYTINRNQILIEQPIKNIGIHTVFITLHSEVKVPVTLNVALSQEEALNQMQNSDDV